VLDWNKNSIEYYKKKGAINISEEEGWQAFRYHNNAPISEIIFP
jgi:hypothetical protein